MNNSIKYAKRRYFNENLAANKKDPQKTWQLINELNSRHHKRKTIAHIEIGDNKISSAADTAEAFNHHFAKIGHDLARGIPLVNTQPESFLISADTDLYFRQLLYE